MYVRNLSAITKRIKYDLQLVNQQRKHKGDAILPINARGEKRGAKKRTVNRKPK